MDDIRWADPPPRRSSGGRGGGVRAEFVAALRGRPGEWAQYQPGHRHHANAVRGMTLTYPGVEATSRARSDGMFDVFARWVGNGDEA